MTHDATDRHVPGLATLAVHAGGRPGRAPPAPFDADLGAGSGTDAGPPGPEAFCGVRLAAADAGCAALEERIAALEGGTAAVAACSGQAARLIAFHALMEPGDEFVAATALDPGTVAQFAQAFARFGWHVRWADPADPAAFAAAVTEKTRAIFVEALSGSGLVADMAALAEVAARARVPLVVDNTLATPCLLRPLEHGADIVVHSATAFLCGRGGAAGGAIVDGGTFDWMADGRFPSLSKARPDRDGLVLAEAFGNFAFAVAAREVGLRHLGSSLSPSDAATVLAGIETLPLRMRRQSDTALEVARFLSEHPAVSRVDHPGLPGHPGHALAQRYLRRGAGAAFAFDVAGGRDAGAALVSRLALFSRAAEVGGARALALPPASTTQRRLAEGQRVAAGAGSDAVRLSVGLEDAADLIADLDQALARVGTGVPSRSDGSRRDGATATKCHPSM